MSECACVSGSTSMLRSCQSVFTTRTLSILTSDPAAQLLLNCVFGGKMLYGCEELEMIMERHLMVQQVNVGIKKIKRMKTHIKLLKKDCFT